MPVNIGRPELIAALGGVATWPLASRAQQPDAVRRIGVLMTVSADDPDQQNGVAAFVQALQQLGWTDGRNVRIDKRWAAGDASAICRHADDLVALAPEARRRSTVTRNTCETQHRKRTRPKCSSNASGSASMCRRSAE
jgi:putative ABC transport system substrate-binding protein